MLKYILLSLLFGASLAQICPPSEDMFPCTCLEEEKAIICLQVEGAFDIKGHFSNISSLFTDDIIFSELSIWSNPGLVEIPADSITNLRFLEINIFHNDNLEHISPDAFNATYSVTTHLNMFQNPALIHGSPYSERDIFDFFSKFVEAELIWALEQAIPVIPANAFGPLPKLKVIDLGMNSIASIGDNAFSRLSNLSNVWLGPNNLTSEGISPTAFQGVGSQVEIDLTFNPAVDHLPEERFKGLLDEILFLGVGGAACPIGGCTYGYLECDERADWICGNQAMYEPKLIGFRCAGFDTFPMTTIWNYCANLTSSAL